MCAIDLPRLGSKRADSSYGFECSLIERVEHTVIRSPVKWNHFEPVDWPASLQLEMSASWW